jgi:uncharacterized lipoprotein YddW (UPF0748 family)
MHHGAASRWARRTCAALALIIGVCALQMRTPAASFTTWVPPSGGSPEEVRALWVLRTSLTTPASIEGLVRTAHDHGFNTLLVQVRGRGDAYYQSELEPRASDLARQPSSFDPLATVIAEAHRVGLRVHAWINVNLVSSAVELPVARDHVVYRHPEWLMVPRAIAQDVAKIDPASPGYIGKIARWTRDQQEKVEGLYASPLQPAAADYAQTVVTDIARRYALDGIHLDYIRYPNDQFDYSRFAIAAFRASVRPALTPSLRRELDGQEAVDLFAYPDRFPDQWKAFRRAQLSALLVRVRNAVKSVRPDGVFSVAAAPDPQEAYDVRLQDWRSWVERKLVDAICPMAYAPEPARFAQQIAQVRDVASGSIVWAGIGAYRLKPEQTIENIQTARRLGAAGFVLFSYDSVAGAKGASSDYLDAVSRGAFGFARATETSSR